MRIAHSAAIRLTFVLAGLLAVSPEIRADEAATMCGGIAGIRCAEGQFCEFPENTCNVADGSGFCAPRPQACTREYLPVCGCDGKTYGNDCERRAAAAAKLKDGAC